MRNPPRSGAPYERTFLDGIEVKWCTLCCQWNDHCCAGHPAEEENKSAEGDGDNNEGNVAIEREEDIEESDGGSLLTGGFARPRNARLI